MATQQTTVVGIFEQRQDARTAINQLKTAGFHDDQIGFTLRDEQAHDTLRSKHGLNAVTRGVVGGIMGVVDLLLVPFIGPSDATNILANSLPIAEEAIDRLPYPGSTDEPETIQRPDAPMRVSTPEILAAPTSEPVPEDVGQQGEVEDHPARQGTVTGGVVGGVLGAAAVALILPGIGPIVAGGILAGALSGAVVGGASGNFLGTFTNMGIPEERAQSYEQAIKGGSTLVTVHTTDAVGQAESILQQAGAHDVEAHKEVVM